MTGISEIKFKNCKLVYQFYHLHLSNTKYIIISPVIVSMFMAHILENVERYLKEDSQHVKLISDSIPLKERDSEKIMKVVTKNIRNRYGSMPVAKTDFSFL